jgi:DNA-directed RNA polymerase subunit L
MFSLVKKQHITTKEFTYSVGDVSLKFSLRIDTKSQLKDFKELLEKALEEIKNELED